VCSLTASVLSGQSGPLLVDVAHELGVDVQHYNGMSGQLYFAEHMGGAVALFDFDNDGDLDLYVGQGAPLGDVDPSTGPYPYRGEGVPRDRLFRNDRAESGATRIRFVDVTEASGLDARGYSMGVATGDYDSDGDVDLYVLNYGANQLWQNQGDGTFRDQTATAGVGDPRWSVAANFFDYDRDGDLDLYVGNYVEFRIAVHKQCASAQGIYDYCGPKAYTPEANRLYRNRGDGTFEDVTASVGMEESRGATLGTVVADLNDDGWLDLYVANDQMENELWLGREGEPPFELDTLSGTAVDMNGQPQASMGVIAEDLTGDGLVDLFMTHLLREMNTLYQNLGGGLFEDISRKSGLGGGSYSSTGFGTVVFDADSDGLLDVYVANGAVKRIEEQRRAGDELALSEPNLLFLGQGAGRYALVPDEQRESPVVSEVGRGLAAGDIDNDGDVDLVLVNNAGPVRVLENRSNPAADRWWGIVLHADKPVSHARVGLRLEGVSQPVWRRSHTDGSYGAAHDPRVVLVLPKGDKAAAVVVRWPDGALEDFALPEAGRYSELVRGTGTKSGSATDTGP
jgi:hypothetical protein